MRISMPNRWFLALFLVGLASLVLYGTVTADTPVQDVSVPVSRWMVLNPETNKLYIDSYSSGSFLTVLDGDTYDTTDLDYPVNDWFVDAAVDPLHNRIYILPGSYLSDSPILVIDGETDTWLPSLPVPTNTDRRENYELAVDALNQFLYFAEESTSSDVRVHWLDALTGDYEGGFNAGNGGVVDLGYNPVNDCAYLLTAHYQSGSWDHNTVWALDFENQIIRAQEDVDVQDARLVINERTGDVYVGTLTLDGLTHVVRSSTLPAQVRVLNAYTNQAYCFNSGGTLYEVDGATLSSRPLRNFAEVTCDQVDCVAINPALNKLYLFSDSQSDMYVYDPERDLLQTLSADMPQSAAANPNNHRLYLAYPYSGLGQVSIFGGAPTLNVSPSTLSFVALQDGDAPPTQAFIVRMGSGDLGNLRYTVASDAAWLSADKTGRFLDWYPVSTTLEAQVQAYVDITDLPASDTPYVGHLTVSSQGANSSPRTVSVNLIVGDGESPLMQVDAANPARFEVMEGQAAPGPHTVGVRNLGAGSLTYTVTEDIPWLDVAGPNPGSVGASSLQTLTLSINSAFASLDPGTYSAPITVTSDSLGSPQTIHAELLIYPRPRLALSTRTMPFNAFVEAGDPARQYLFVNNDGGGLLDWDATSETAWLRTDGALAGRAPSWFQVGADISTLELGLYHGQITVAGDSPDVEDSPQDVDIPLNVDTARRMALSTVRLDDFAFVEGDTPAAQSFRIYNAGSGGAFDWEIETDAAWLTFDATSGTADEGGTDVQVSLDTGQLTVGEHNATITVRGDRVKGAVQTIRVAAFVASASAPNCLPDVHLDVVKTSLAEIEVDIVSVDAYQGSACDVTADVDLDVYGFRHTYRVQGSISQANELLLPIAETINLGLAKVGLSLSSIEISNDALTAQGRWDFGSLLGQTRSAGTVRIGRTGLTFDGGVTFPIDQTWGFKGFSFHAEQGQVRAAQSFSDIVLEVEGELIIKIFGSSDVRVDVLIQVARYGGVRVKGGVGQVPLPNFGFSLAGFGVQTRDVRFVDGKIKIARAEIKTPGNWGGLGTDIYDITIDGNGKISVGGGKFNLPTIKAGGLNLMSLEGVLRETSFSHTANGLLRPAAAGYEIQASGEFAVPGMGGGGACSIMVDVTIYVNSLGANVLELAPVEPATGLGSQQADAVDGFGLRQVTVGLHCLPGVPLGNTGFFITGVQGSITLHDRVESVSLKMWIEHATRIGNASLLSTDPQLTLYFSPFAIDFTAGLRVLNIKVAETGVHIDKNHFSTHISYDFLIIHGYTSLSAGTYNGKKYIAGSGKTSIGISKGRIWKKCVLGVCVKIPPWTINLGSIGIDFGTFKNGKFGVKGSINVFGWKGGVFVGFDGTVKFGKLNDYQLVGSQRVRQARVAYLMRRQGESPQAPLDPDISFAPNGDTLVHVSISSLASQDAGPEERDLAAMPEFAPLMPGDVISTVSVLRSDVIFALAQEPGGELAFTLMEPDGDPITPDALPSNVEYVQTIGAEEIQSTYFVEYAAAGDWQVRIIGDTDSTDFTLAVIGNTPPPAALAAIGATGPTTATVAWIAQVAVTETSTASLYAHSRPLTRTVTYTDSTGVLITETEQVFEGMLVAEGLTTTMGLDAYSRVIDFGPLPSGVYALWLEVDDDENPRHRSYILSGITYGPPMTLTVDHSPTFPTNWTATLTPTLEGIQSGDMHVAWQADAHPDALTYTLHLATQHSLTPTLQTTRVFTVSDVAYGSVETVQVDNVLPGQVYTFTLAVHNQQDGRIAWSQPVTLHTPQPDFILLAPTTPITVPAGQAAYAPLTLFIPDNIPFPLALSPGYIAAPDGFILGFTPEVITATGTVTPSVRIEAVSGMYTGTYAVPVLAQSGALEHTAVLEVKVVEADYGLYLPVVLR